MLANKLIERSFKLELDSSRKLCNVHVADLEEGFYHWKIVTLNAEVVMEKTVAVNARNSFSIPFDKVLSGQYILTISAEGQGTRHLKLVV